MNREQLVELLNAGIELGQLGKIPYRGDSDAFARDVVYFALKSHKLTKSQCDRLYRFAKYAF